MQMTKSCSNCSCCVFHSRPKCNIIHLAKCLHKVRLKSGFHFIYMQTLELAYHGRAYNEVIQLNGSGSLEGWILVRDGVTCQLIIIILVCLGKYESLHPTSPGGKALLLDTSNGQHSACQSDLAWVTHANIRSPHRLQRHVNAFSHLLQRTKKNLQTQVSPLFWHESTRFFTCHGQIRSDRFVLCEGQERCDDGTASTRPILWRGSSWHMDMDGRVAEECGRHADLCSIAACKGVRNVCALFHDVP